VGVWQSLVGIAVPQVVQDLPRSLGLIQRHWGYDANMDNKKVNSLITEELDTG
jgi:hypothetical protein